MGHLHDMIYRRGYIYICILCMYIYIYNHVHISHISYNVDDPLHMYMIHIIYSPITIWFRILQPWSLSHHITPKITPW